jgi:23S rRNA (cytosine1962-C5)-methyltransferase
MTSPQISGYSLLDSGDGRKLERFGDRIIDRPSSLSAWRRRQPDSTWERADARYHHPDKWEFPNSKPFKEWRAEIAGVSIGLELMSNGQVGLFPEHAIYLADVAQTIKKFSQSRREPVQVLNLFAYTGLATSFCAKLPYSTLVTHVDLAKRAIDRAKLNSDSNQIAQDKIRWIVDDALGFMAREARKQKRYDVVIIDPPSFSRVSKQNTWTLDEKAPEIVTLTLDVLNPDSGVVYFTNHSSASTSDVARNIALDRFADKQVEIDIRSLALNEELSPRRLPAGSLIVLSHRG